MNRNIALFLWVFLNVPVSLHSQPGIFSLGDKNAVVYDMTMISQTGTLAASMGNRIEVWDYRSMTLLNTWPVNKVAAIDYQYEMLAGGSELGTLLLWNIN